MRSASVISTAPEPNQVRALRPIPAPPLLLGRPLSIPFPGHSARSGRSTPRRARPGILGLRLPNPGTLPPISPERDGLRPFQEQVLWPSSALTLPQPYHPGSQAVFPVDSARQRGRDPTAMRDGKLPPLLPSRQRAVEQAQAETTPR